MLLQVFFMQFERTHEPYVPTIFHSHAIEQVSNTNHLKDRRLVYLSWCRAWLLRRSSPHTPPLHLLLLRDAPAWLALGTHTPPTPRYSAGHSFLDGFLACSLLEPCLSPLHPTQQQPSSEDNHILTLSSTKDIRRIYER